MTSQQEVTLEGTKKCSKCRQWHAFSNFAAKPHLSSGLDSWCRECKRASNREWRDRNRDRYNTQRRVERAARRAA
jgi:hypothetical protein